MIKEYLQFIQEQNHRIFPDDLLNFLFKLYKKSKDFKGNINELYQTILKKSDYDKNIICNGNGIYGNDKKSCYIIKKLDLIFIHNESEWDSWFSIKNNNVYFFTLESSSFISLDDKTKESYKNLSGFEYMTKIYPYKEWINLTKKIYNIK